MIPGRRPATPPRGLRYHWSVVAGAFVSHLLNYGILTVAFGVLLPSMASALELGRGALASANALSRVVSAAIGPLLGPLVDRQGPRPVMIAGVVSLTVGGAMLALSTSAWHVFVAYGVVMALGGVALGELTADSTVTRWFVRRRGIALAFATMGLSAAGIVVPLPLAFVIDRWGWRQGWLALSVAALVGGLAAVAVMRRSPEQYGLEPDGDRSADRRARGGGVRPVVSLTARAAARTPAFWLLVSSTNLAGLALFGVNLHLFAYMTDKGVAAGTAAALLTYLYLLHTVAKPLWGVIAARIHVRYCIAACYVGGGAALCLLLGPPSSIVLLAFATLYGLTRGAQSFVTSLAWADYFGRDAQGAIRGLASPFRFLAYAAGPLLGGFLYDATGSYVVAFALFALAFGVGGALALVATPPASMVPTAS